ncbi:hypothetical protein [Skermanella pratensis]|nr:hypothetical protein [Skermanella pratensis]
MSPEVIEDIAHQFNVSELAVRTLLVHHDRLEPEILDKDMDFAA